MTPIEAAVKVAREANIIKWHPGDFEDSVMASDIAPIITAFLEAAAEDDAVLMAAQSKGEQLAGDRTSGALREAMGDIATKGAQAAILALKEAVE